MSAFDVVSETLQDVADLSPEAAEIVAEALPRVNAMLQVEDIGWTELFSGTTNGDLPGPGLDRIKEVSGLAREMVLGSPLITRGLDLRTSYVWSKGILVDGAPDQFEAGSGTRKRGPKSQKERFFKNRSFIRYVLSAEAFKDMEGAAFTDGSYILLGDDATKELHPIPFSEIDAVYLNPDYEGEILAYRRTWDSFPVLGAPAQTKSVWYYVDSYKGNRVLPEAITAGDPNPPTVDKGKTIFVKSFNTMVGWPLGVPDALPALKWARIYSELVQVGITVSKANAKFVYKTKSNTAAGASNAAAKASTSKGVGNVAALGNNNDLISIPQANRSWDFNGIRPIASQVATALNVSVVHILSDPGAAGSYYGSASNLDLPTKRAMVSRQEEWVDFIQRVIEWGTGESLAVSFPSLDDPDPYREGQLQTMIWNSGLVHPEEARPRMLAIGGITPTREKAPTGVMTPNNEKSLNRGDIDNDGSGGANGGTSVASTASSPDQGTRNGTGGVSDSVAKDLRNEALVSEMFEALKEVSKQVETLALMVESKG